MTTAKGRPAARARSVAIIVGVALLLVVAIYLWLQPSYGGALLDFGALRSGWTRFLRAYGTTDDQCSVLDFNAELDTEGRFLTMELKVLVTRDEGPQEAYSIQFPGEGGALPTHELKMAQVDPRLAEIQVRALIDDVEALARAGFLPDKVPFDSTYIVRIDGLVRHIGDHAWDESTSRGGISLLDGRVFRLCDGALVEQIIEEKLEVEVQPLAVQINHSGAQDDTPGSIVLVDAQLSKSDR